MQTLITQNLNSPNVSTSVTDTMKSFQILQETLKAEAKNLGLDLILTDIKYGDTGLSVSMTAEFQGAKSSNKITKRSSYKNDKNPFKRFGINPEKIMGKKLELLDQTFTLIDVKSVTHRYPFIVQDDEGKKINMSVNQIRSAKIQEH